MGEQVKGQTMTPDDGPDTELRRILALASRVEPPAGAAGRLMARLAEAGTDGGKVVALQPRRRQGSRWLYVAAAVPLAASLALGIYLGAMGKMDLVLPSSITGNLALNADQDSDFTGIGEAEAYAEEHI
jgi:hypothetical protein